jgi:ABC-type nitrate/sulfonate/bicarbonate transport system substrate-binding protein
MTVALLDRSTEAVATGTQVLRLGFMPLSDSAPLLVAEALGLFRRHGVSVALSACSSWAGLRDRVMVGALDGAQMLAPMPIAAALGLGGVRARFAVTATTSRNGNTITLGESLAAVLPDAAGPLTSAAFATALATRKARGLRPPVLAVVFAFSSHNYLLRHWLAAGGIDPDRDLHLVVVPPPLVAEQLACGEIDGFCSGEPWGSRAVDLRVGRIALTTSDIWPDHPEKLLAFGAAVLEADPQRVVAATAAVIEAANWLADPANGRDAAQLLHDRAMPDVPVEILALALAGRLVRAPDEAAAPAAPMFRGGGATAPDPAHGAWWFAQMVRWRHAPDGETNSAQSLWRPDLWRAAALAAGMAEPVIADIPAPPSSVELECSH